MHFIKCLVLYQRLDFAAEHTQTFLRSCRKQCICLLVTVNNHRPVLLIAAAAAAAADDDDDDDDDKDR